MKKAVCFIIGKNLESLFKKTLLYIKMKFKF